MIRENQTLLNRLNVLLDGMLLLLALILSYLLRFEIMRGGVVNVSLGVYLLYFTPFILLRLLLYGFGGVYAPGRRHAPGKPLRVIVAVNTVLFIVELSGMYMLKMLDLSRIALIVYYVTGVLLVCGKHALTRKVLEKLRASGRNLKRVIIVGSGPNALSYLDEIERRPEYGFTCIGYVADEQKLRGTWLGGFNALKAVLAQYEPDELICALDASEQWLLSVVVEDSEGSGTRLSVIPVCYRYIPRNPVVDQMGDVPLINIRNIPLDNYANAFIKRITDVVLSGLGLIALSPLMCLTALLLKCTQKGTVLFRQTRVGENKKLFTMYKFRTMVESDNADTAWSGEADSRRTKLGALLRKTSIDELPQLFNVIKGDMSLVGPRPELPYFVEEFRKDVPLYMVRHQVKPGITGLAQINGCRGDTPIPARIHFDVEYVETWTYGLDIYILFRTVLGGFMNGEKVEFGA